MRHVILVAIIAIYLAQPVAEFAAGFPMEQLQALEAIKARNEQRETDALFARLQKGKTDADDAGELAGSN